MAELSRLSDAARVEDVVAALERDGGVVLEGFLAPQTLDGLRRDLLPLLERQSVGRDGFAGFSTRRLSPSSPIRAIARRSRPIRSIWPRRSTSFAGRATSGSARIA
jgi:hypothetical protein